MKIPSPPGTRAPAQRHLPTAPVPPRNPRHLRRKLIHPAPLHGRRSVPHASQRKRMIAHPADHVLRLPHPPPRQARPRVQRIEPRHPDQLSRPARRPRRPPSCRPHPLTSPQQQPERRRRRPNSSSSAKAISTCSVLAGGTPGTQQPHHHIEVVQRPVLPVGTRVQYHHRRAEVSARRHPERQVDVDRVLRVPRRRPGQRRHGGHVRPGPRDQRVPPPRPLPRREEHRRRCSGILALCRRERIGPWSSTSAGC